MTEHIPNEESKMLPSINDLEKTPIFKRKANSIFPFAKMESKNYTEINRSIKSKATSQDSDSFIKHQSYNLSSKHIFR